MIIHNKCHPWIFLFIVFLEEVLTAEEYNVLHTDGSYEFGYDTPDSFHRAEANRYNVVKGEFGARSPKTGAIDTTVYTAGPRGYRPRGKNIVRKYDLSQIRRGPIGTRDDPYYDPNEDPSYSFAFRTRTYDRQEAANSLGDVTGRYSYIDDIGERHNVEFIAGKNTGFHVKTPYPDSNPRAYGSLFFNGRGKPIPRGRTSIQRGLDGSYKFVSTGPDQRRTESSDARGHVRGSYTYLDDKGVQHSVHYIAGPGIGYRVLKNVKGPHLPSTFPFGRPGVPDDFYDYADRPEDVFDTAASGHVKPPPLDNTLGGSIPDTERPSFGSSEDENNNDYDGGFSNNKPGSRPGGSKPSFGTPIKPSRPSYGSSGGGLNKPSYEGDEDEDVGDVFGEIGGVSGGSGSTSRPNSVGGSPGSGFTPPKGDSDFDDGSYKPSGGATGLDDGSFKPSEDDGSYKPDSGESGSNRPQIGSGGVGNAFDNTGDGGSKEQGGSFEQGGGINRPGFVTKPQKPSYNDYDSGEVNADFGLFDSGSNVKPPSSIRPGGRPSSGSTNRPGLGGSTRPGSGHYRPGGGSSSRPGVSTGSIRPGAGGGSGRPGTGGRPGVGGFGGSNRPSESGFDDFSGDGFYGSGGGASLGWGDRYPSYGEGGTIGVGIIGGPSGGNGLYNYKGGTIITNLGDKHFSVPPGVSVRAHVQAIDLLPLGTRIPSPSEQFKADTKVQTEQLNEAASNNLISNSTITITTTTAADVDAVTESSSTNSTNSD